MHLTQHESSDEIYAKKEVHYTQLTNGFYHKFHLDLSGDSRVDGIVKDLQAYIKKQTDHHHAPSEEQIAARTVQLIHSNKYYGPYNKHLDVLNNQIDTVRVELDDARKHGRTREAGGLQTQLDTLNDAANHITHTINAKTHLRDLKKGELFCVHESAVTVCSAQRRRAE